MDEAGCWKRKALHRHRKGMLLFYLDRN